jgi:beta-aspartyl-peptidase (threonine type)
VRNSLEKVSGRSIDGASEERCRGVCYWPRVLSTNEWGLFIMWTYDSTPLVRFLTSMLLLGMIENEAQTAEPQRPITYAIAVHGGAGAWGNRKIERSASVRTAMEEALRLGRDVLANGGDSLDAVEKTIRYLEDSPLFNAGRGATFNAAGKHELDASIMRGSDRAAGAVAAVSVVKNPISLARRVMSDTKHVLLVAKGADDFARSIGAEIVDPEFFWTDQTRAEWNEERPANEDQSSLPPASEPDHYGTVGCVALDQHGNLAAGTSTGGLKMKQVGRVGDSAVIGAGTYADNDSCAVSCTGVGELFIRHAVAYDVSARMRYQKATLNDAVGIQVSQRLPEATAGLIAVARTGEITMAFNTAAMPRGLADSSGRFAVLIEHDQ